MARIILGIGTSHTPMLNVGVDDWLRFEMESPNASGGRGLCLAHVYDSKDVLVATLAQEGLIRLRQGAAG